MFKQPIPRRTFIQTCAAAAVAARAGAAEQASPVTSSKPALLGGDPVRKKPFPEWPQIDASYEPAWLDVLRKCRWGRGGRDSSVTQFESEYAKTIGVKRCVATANGTSALFASLRALDVGPGDEVIVPPYTFIATINVVLLHHALPVFADTDRETFQVDPASMEKAITDRTRVLLPVHIGGNPANMDAISSLSTKRGIPVLEDACQAHLAEWRGKRIGSLGEMGCFSFQSSKNLSSGEGGALTTNREDLYERAFVFHKNGGAKAPSRSFSYDYYGANLKITAFQGTLLLQQLARLEAQSKTRETNAAYLTKRLAAIPGIRVAKSYEGCTRNAYHPLHVSLRAGGLLRAIARSLPEGAGSGRDSCGLRLQSVEYAAFPQGSAVLARIPACLRQVHYRRLF